MVQYPVEVSNGTVTLTPQSVFKNNTVELQYPVEEYAGLGIWPSSVGGIAVAAQTLFGSNMSLYFDSIYAIDSTGPMASNYMNSSAEDVGTVNMTWTDPTPDLLSGIRELAFRAAVFKSNASYYQTVNGTETAIETVYIAHYKFLYAALAFVIFGVVGIVPLFMGWWYLGRPVSLSPVKIAKAFAAPLLQGGDSNADVNALLEIFGSREVRYGAVAVAARRLAHPGGGFVVTDGFGLRLEIAEQERVSWPLKGVVY
ncbi:hypothetical protein VTN96DRAFT_9383 [Rasamsonia emersonii]